MIRAAKIFNKNISFYGFDLFENITEKKRVKELSKIPLPELTIKKRLKKISNNVFLYKGYSHKTLKKFITKKKLILFLLMAVIKFLLLKMIGTIAFD